MCLSDTYEEKGHTLLMSNTSRVVLSEDGELVIRSLFGEEVRVKGIVTSIDFEKNELTIRCEE